MLTILLSLLAMSAAACAMHETIPVPDGIVTCAGRCGEGSGPPCSCDDKCLLYQNCCENMTLDCPDIWGQGQVKYGQMQHSEVKCHMTGHYVISSCPVNNNASQENKVTSGKKDHNEEKTLLLMVNEVLEKGPVTDVTMGITYNSTEILTCHRGNLTHVVRWTGVFKYQLRESPISRKEDFVLDQYIPTDTLTESQLGPECHWSAIDQCPADTDPHLESLCKGFTSYIKKIGTEKVYKNRFCYQCVNSNQDGIKPFYDNVNGRKLNAFSVLASISTSALKIVPSPGPFITGFYNWDRVTCNLTFDSVTLAMDEMEEEKEECHIDTCGVSYELRPNGQCEAPHLAIVSFFVDEFPFSPQQFTCLPDFMKCVFMNILNLGETKPLGQPSIYVDTTSQRLMHVIRLETYLPLIRETLVDIYFHPQQILELSTAAKVLKNHVVRKHTQMSLEAFEKNLTSAFTGQSLSSLKSSTNMSDYQEIASVDFIKKNSVLKTDDSFKNRGKVKENTSTTICVYSMFPIDSPGVPYLFCFEDRLYQSDLAMMDALRRLPCLAVFDGCGESGTGRLTSCVCLVLNVALVTAKILLLVP